MSVQGAIDNYLGPTLGFIMGTVKAVIELGLAVETFVYGAIGAAGVLFIQELYKFVKGKIKQNNNKNGKVE